CLRFFRASPGFGPGEARRIVDTRQSLAPAKSLAPAFLLLFLPLSFHQAPTTSIGADYFELTPATRDAYTKVINLRFSEARSALDQLRRNEPDNLLPLLVENYLDFLTVFVDNDEATYKRLSKNMAPRLERIGQGEPRSPWRLYCQGEIRLQWAILRGQYNDMLSSLNDINLAYGLLQENQRLFPDFMPNKKSLAILHTALSNTPEEYKWALKAFTGMSGSAQQGLQEIEAVLAYAKSIDFVFLEETLIAYAFMQLYLNDNETAAWATLNNQPRLDTRQNPLAAFVVASVGRRTGHNDDAIRILQTAPRGGAYHPFHYLDYQLGISKLSRLDKDADQPLQQFLRHFKGQNGIKETYQKLAWHQLVQGNPAGYSSYMAQLKNRGATRIEPDKAAQREAEENQLPDVRLLQARLLFDGCYYARAYDLLKNAGPEYAGDKKRHLEYTYRQGRIAHKMGKTNEAIILYNQTIANGATETSHYACSAALQLGDLQASRGDYRAARVAYQQCLSLNPPDYADSLHARAKAGLNRIKGK
ncbi:MAG: tetratricopeptide repeat protein, partial [Saprospiraceae bacterium]|nr:tetratricopeptide repeat protein [Saprospiraceae bacterium]